MSGMYNGEYRWAKRGQFNRAMSFALWPDNFIELYHECHELAGIIYSSRENSDAGECDSCGKSFNNLDVLRFAARLKGFNYGIS